MLIRIVRLTFREEKIDEFLEIFHRNKNKIRNFPGCHHLELWKDYQSENILLTYSLWENQSSLQEYRNSQLFEEVWIKTKSLFKENPVAFSSRQIEKV